MTKKAKIIIGVSAGVVVVGTTLFFILRKRTSLGSPLIVSSMTPGPNIYGFHWNYGSSSGDVDPESIGNLYPLDATYSMQVTSYSGITAAMLSPSNLSSISSMIKTGNGSYVLAILKNGVPYKSITVTKNGNY